MLKLENLSRVYRLAGREIRALDGIDLTIREGEYLRVIGASGSGKSTLLNLLAALDHPTEGSIHTPIGDLARLGPRELSLWRSRHVGMVFQTFNLIQHRTALQNVEIGLLFAGVARREREHEATHVLDRLGLGDRLHHRPADLSGGEQQRVAIARALVKRPRFLFADEPTGNLDEESALGTSRLLAELNGEGITIVLVTHDAGLARDDTHRTVRMHYGRIVETVEHRALPAGARP